MALSRRTGVSLREPRMRRSECRRGARPVGWMGGLPERGIGPAPEPGRRAYPERRCDNSRRGRRGKGIRIRRLGIGAPFLGPGDQDRRAGPVGALPSRRAARHRSAAGHGTGAEDETEKDQERREWPPSHTVMCLVRHLGLLLALMPMWVRGIRFQPAFEAAPKKLEQRPRCAAIPRLSGTRAQAG
jgi:hypothetical protein